VGICVVVGESVVVGGCCVGCSVVGGCGVIGCGVGGSVVVVAVVVAAGSLHWQGGAGVVTHPQLLMGGVVPKSARQDDT